MVLLGQQELHDATHDAVASLVVFDAFNGETHTERPVVLPLVGYGGTVAIGILQRTVGWRCRLKDVSPRCGIMLFAMVVVEVELHAHAHDISYSVLYQSCHAVFIGDDGRLHFQHIAHERLLISCQHVAGNVSTTYEYVAMTMGESAEHVLHLC